MTTNTSVKCHSWPIAVAHGLFDLVPRRCERATFVSDVKDVVCAKWASYATGKELKLSAERIQLKCLAKCSRGDSLQSPTDRLMRVHFALRPQKRDGLLGTGDGGGGGERKSECSTADTARKRPERPWTAARTTEVLRRVPSPFPSD